MKLIRIKDLGRTVTGHTPPTSESKYYGDFMPFVKPTDIDVESKYTYSPEQYYSEEAAEKYKTSLIPKGSTCVVCIGTIGEKMTMAHCDLFTNQSINSIIPSQEYDPDYVFYLLKYNLGKVKALNKGTASGREFVSKSTFLEMEVSVFEDKATQERIGSILSAYDSLIENNQQQIRLLKEAANRLYKEWFIDFNYPGCSCSDQNDFLPDGWKRVKLDDSFMPIITGKKDANFATPDGQYAFFTCAQEPSKAPSYSFDTEAVILAGNGDFNVKLFRGKFEAYQRTYVLSPYNKDMLFLLYYCIEDNMRSLAKGAAGSTIKFLTKGMIQSVSIVVPPADVLSAFNSIVEPIQSSIESLSLSNSLLRKAQDALLPRLISGETIV